MKKMTGGTGRQISNTYVYGTEARALNSVVQQVQPDIEKIQREKRLREQRKREKIANNREMLRMHKINMLYTAAAVVVVAFMFAVCVQYLELQSGVKNAANDVARLEAKLTQLTVKNDETKMEIDGSIDYDELLRIAVEELGMAYPIRGQIVEYESSESEYVKQYKDIPTVQQ